MKRNPYRTVEKVLSIVKKVLYGIFLTIVGGGFFVALPILGIIFDWGWVSFVGYIFTGFYILIMFVGVGIGTLCEWLGDQWRMKKYDWDRRSDG